MKELLELVILSELVISVAGVLFYFFVLKYRELFPSTKYGINDKEMYKPINEEIYDDGYIEDVANYDNRISDMKGFLDGIKHPSVEVITDEYEKELEK